MSDRFLDVVRSFLFESPGAEDEPDDGEVEADHGPGRFEVRATVVTCGHCGGTEFVRGYVSWYHSVTLHMSLPWLETDRRPSKLVCTHCTHVETFATRPELVEWTGEP